MSGRGRLGLGGPAALHDHRVLRQEASRAQDGEQEATQAQVSLGEGMSEVGWFFDRRLYSRLFTEKALNYVDISSHYGG